MKVKNLIKIALMNMLKKKYIYIKMFVSMSFAFFITILVFVYSQSLLSKHEDYLESDSSRNVIEYLTDISSDELEEIKKDSNVSGVIMYDDLTLNFDNKIEIEIGGVKQEINFKTFNYSVATVDPLSDGIILENILDEYKQKYGDTVFSEGRSIENKGETVISESVRFMLKNIGYNNFLGQEMILYSDGVMIFNKQICGIMNSNLYQINGFYHNIIAYKEYGSQNEYASIGLKSFSLAENSIEYINNVLGYSDNENAFIFWYNGERILEKMKFINGQSILCNQFLSVICVVILVVIFFHATANQYYMIKKNSAFYGIIKAQGASGRDLFLIFFSEVFFNLHYFDFSRSGNSRRHGFCAFSNPCIICFCRNHRITHKFFIRNTYMFRHSNRVYCIYNYLCV